MEDAALVNKTQDRTCLKKISTHWIVKELANVFYFVLVAVFIFFSYAYIFKVNLLSYGSPKNEYEIDLTNSTSISHAGATQSAQTLLLLLFGGHAAGYVTGKLRLPRSLGMLVFGLFFNSFNAGVIHPHISFLIRRCSLILVISKAALGFNLRVWKQTTRLLYWTSIVRCVLEMGIIFCIVAVYRGGKVQVAIMIASALAATCPFLLKKPIKGGGNMPITKVQDTAGIIASIEQLRTYIVFCFVLSPMYYERTVRQHLVLSSILGGELLVGVLFGIVSGLLAVIIRLLMGRYPARYRVVLFVSAIFGGFFIFDKFRLFLGGSAAIFTFVAAHAQRKKDPEETEDTDNKVAVEERWLDTVWTYAFEPLLYAMIGLELPLIRLEVSTIYFAFALAMIAFAMRIGSSFVLPCGMKNKKEAQDQSVENITYTTSDRAKINLCSLRRSGFQAALAFIPMDICSGHKTGIDGFFAVSIRETMSDEILFKCEENAQMFAIVMVAVIMLLPSFEMIASTGNDAIPPNRSCWLYRFLASEALAFLYVVIILLCRSILNNASL